MTNQWQEETVPARCPSPVPPQTTPPVSARPAPVLRAASTWAATGAQRRAYRQGLPLQVRTEVEEREKLKKRPKTEWRRCRGALVSSGTASAPCRLFAATAGVPGRTTGETGKWTNGGEIVQRFKLKSIHWDEWFLITLWIKVNWFGESNISSLSRH